MERNDLYSTGSSADTDTHKDEEPLVLHKKKKRKEVPISTVRYQNSILVNIKLAQSKLAHIKERIKRNPKRAHRVLQLHNQAFCQLCRTLLADSRVCKGVSHTTKSPPKKKKKESEKGEQCGATSGRHPGRQHEWMLIQSCVHLQTRRLGRSGMCGYS